MTDFEVGENVMLISCAHRFHEACISNWFNENTTCPICKSEVLSI